MSSTRFPAAKVLCKVLPRLARATQGPKLLMSATVGISTPVKSTCPRLYSATEVNSIAKSSSRITVLVTAMLYPALHFILDSLSERASVRAFISARRASPWPYCIVSSRPRRLSSTKALSSPDSRRNTMPSSPLSREVRMGTATPTTT